MCSNLVVQRVANSGKPQKTSPASSRAASGELEMITFKSSMDASEALSSHMEVQPSEDESKPLLKQ